jgi:signal transduction histidine kinase
MLRLQADRVSLLLTTLENALWSPSYTAEKSFALRVGPLIRQADLSCTTALDSSGDPIFTGGSDCGAIKELLEATRATLSSGKQVIRFFGRTWGVFWLQDRYMTLANPLIHSGDAVGAIGATINLDELYRQERRSQKFFFIYIVINIAILTFIGVYRISKIYLEPLHRLSKRAEDYREESDEMVFAVRKEDNELHHLSKALNRMLVRIADDKKKLRSTVTSLENANLNLKNAQQEIIRAEKLASVGRLSAGIAHEIGNPIGIVMGYLELLKQENVAIDEEEKREYIRRTENEINRINTIIRQLLDLSRPSSEGADTISVHEVITELTDVVKLQPLMSNINIVVDLRAENDRVVADNNQLRQVFLNLMLNAADAVAANPSDEKGRLLIRSSNPPESFLTERADLNQQAWIKIEVIDNGMGIDAEQLGNIFDPFFTTKEPGKGTGLGLSVSFMIVENIGGMITAVSDGSEGTTLIVGLPLAS